MRPERQKVLRAAVWVGLILLAARAWPQQISFSPSLLHPPELRILSSDEASEAVISQGRAFLLMISDPGRLAASMRGRWGDQIIPCLPAEDAGRWYGIGAVPREQPPGRYEVEVIIETLWGSRFRLVGEFTVAAAVFTQSRLKVDPKMVDIPAEYQEQVKEDRQAFLAVRERGSLQKYWKDGFVRPLPGKVTSPFGRLRIYNNSYQSVHPGTDLEAAVGAPVRAAAAGVVVLVRRAYIAGDTIILDHGGGVFTSYSHLGEFLVSEGEEVAAGEVIGRVGLTGRTTGPHLHWGCVVQGIAVDPLSLLELTPRLRAE